MADKFLKSVAGNSIGYASDIYPANSIYTSVSIPASLGVAMDLNFKGSVSVLANAGADAIFDLYLDGVKVFSGFAAEIESALPSGKDRTSSAFYVKESIKIEVTQAGSNPFTLNIWGA